MKGIAITTESKMSIVNYEEPLYQTVGKTVGGFIEIVHPELLPEPYVMIVNEEGLLQGLDINLVGCFLYGTEHHGQPIVGNIVLMKEGFNEDGEPDIVGLESNEQEVLCDAIKKVFHNKIEEEPENDG